MKKKWMTRLGQLPMVIFLIWSGVGITAIGLGFDHDWIDGLAVGEGLKAFFHGCLRNGDFVFIGLATLNVYMASVHRLGLARTRWAALIILPASAVLEYVGTKTGVPFGAYEYTENFGPRLLETLPIAIPLSWFVVVVGAYLLFSQWLPMWSRWQLSFLVGVFAMIFDWFMEPFAYGVRVYWTWEAGSVPLQNYATWLVTCMLLARVAPIHSAPLVKTDWRPAVVLGLMMVMFGVGRVAYGI
jgi:uncharacterized membrane protein